MSEVKQKRPWFRFHLLTAVLTMFISGGLVGLNLGRERKYVADYAVNGVILNPIEKSYHLVGWPLRCDSERQTMYVNSDNEELPIELTIINYTPLYLDGVICVIVLLSVAFAAEYLIRRREARKT
jgi:uncharacterized membrane protein